MSTAVCSLYVAGPMSGLPEFNHPAFVRAALSLRAVGYRVENPAENPAQSTWADYMRLSLRQLSEVEGVAVLSGWQGSRGATLEVHVAHALMLPVHGIATWLAASEDVTS